MTKLTNVMPTECNETSTCILNINVPTMNKTITNIDSTTSSSVMSYFRTQDSLIFVFKHKQGRI